MKAEKYDTCKSTVEFNYKLAWLDECKKIAREVDAGRERCLKAAYVVHGRSQGEFYCMKKFPKASDEGFCSLPKTVATRLNNLNEGALRECFVETENNL